MTVSEGRLHVPAELAAAIQRASNVDELFVLPEFVSAAHEASLLRQIQGPWVQVLTLTRLEHPERPTSVYAQHQRSLLCAR